MSDLNKALGKAAENVGNIFPEQHQWEAPDVNIGSGAEHHDQAGRYGVLHQCVTQGRTFRTHGLTHHSAHAVSSHSAEPPARHRIADVQGGSVSSLAEEQTRHERTANPLAAAEHAVECCKAPERFGPLHLPFVANRQLLAPFGSAACKYLTPCFRCHASAKTMRVPALPLVRLKGSLHLLPSLLMIRLKPTKYINLPKKRKNYNQKERVSMQIPLALPPLMSYHEACQIGRIPVDNL